MPAASINNILEIRLKMGLCNHLKLQGDKKCFCWATSTVFDFKSGGNMKMTVEQKLTKPCYPPSLLEYLKENSFNMLIIILAFGYVLLLLKSIRSSAVLLMKVKAAFEHQQQLNFGLTLLGRSVQVFYSL